MKEKYPDVRWILHFHNTRGMGIANIVAGMQAGVDCFDASFGGIGGCPFVPGAAGNVATEEVLHMCDEMGIETGIDLDRVIETARAVQELLGRDLPSSILKAGKNSDLLANR
jgi:hydroxymethylglutaryl-CoA lyase